MQRATPEADRRTVLIDVLDDYMSVVRSAMENGWHWSSAKSVRFDKIEQSKLQHSQNGAELLLTLYQNLPLDHWYVSGSEDTPDDERLRATLALYFVHDYHKFRSDIDWDFDITLEETEEFCNSIGLDRLWPEINYEVVRSVMAAHHLSDENAMKSEVPPDYMDEFFLVVFADGFASTASVHDMGHVNEKRVHGVLTGYRMVTHEIGKDSLGDTTMAVNKAVANVLQEEGYILLRVYEEGCLYLRPVETELSDIDNLHKRVADEFRECVTDAHQSYSLSFVESASIDDADSHTDYYYIGWKDVLFRGFEDTIRGIVQKSIIESERVSPITKDMECAISRVNETLDIDFHTETRRVQGISKGVHTVYQQFVRFLTDENGPEWKTDPLMATLKIYGLYEDKDIRENMKRLREEQDEFLSSGGREWWYKYPIAQYVYEKYCSGKSRQELENHLTDDVILPNIDDFMPINDIEDMLVSEPLSELTEWVGQTVVFNEGDSETLSTYQENSDITNPYLSKSKAKRDCPICGWGTTVNPNNSHHPKLLDHPESEEIEVNVTGSGVHETVETTGDEPICYMCQLEISLRQTHDGGWGSEDEMVYAHIQSDYGFVPLSWWTFQDTISRLEKHDSGGYSFAENVDSILSCDVPETVSDVHSGMDVGIQVNHLLSPSDAFEPMIRFGGHRKALAPLNDSEALYNAISTVAMASAYSGVRVRFTTRPMSRVKYDTDAQLTFDEEVVESLPFEREMVPVDDIQEFLQMIAAMEKITNELDNSSQFEKSLFTSSYESFDYISNYTEFPGSRLGVMAKNRGVDVDEFSEAVAALDGVFGDEETVAAADEISLYLSEITDGSSRELFEKTLEPVITNGISEVETLATNVASEEADTAYQERIAERYGEQVAELVDEWQSKSESLIRLQKQVGDRLEITRS